MDTFDLAVIGGGTAGLVTSAGAASLGAKVALIERDRLGGECLYTGCVPSKALIRSAKVLHLLRRAADFGLNRPRSLLTLQRSWTGCDWFSSRWGSMTPLSGSGG